MKAQFDLLTLYNFIRKLTTPFEDFPAYEAGIIDADGEILKKRSTLKSADKDKLTYFDVLIINLKKLLAKIPGGQSRFGTFAAAMFLLKEEKGLKDTLIEDYELFERSALAEVVTTAVSAGTSGDPRTRPANPMGIQRRKKKMDITEYLSMVNKKKRKELSGN